MDHEAYAQTIAALLREAVPELIAAYLFGSVARGDATPESDVDVAFLAHRPVSLLARWELQERIAARLGRDVDVVDLRRASSVMRVEVLRDAVVLFDAEPFARQSFEAVALADYARLNEERREILRDVRARGRVHA